MNVIHAYPHAADSSSLQRHLHQCLCASGRTHRLRCVVESVHAVCAPRFVTLVLLLTLVVLAGSAWPA